MPPTGVSSIYRVAWEVVEWASSISYSFIYFFSLKWRPADAKLSVDRPHMPDGHGKSTRAHSKKSRCCLQLVRGGGRGNLRSVDWRLVFISKLSFDPSLVKLMTTFLQ